MPSCDSAKATAVCQPEAGAPAAPEPAGTVVVDVVVGAVRGVGVVAPKVVVLLGGVELLGGVVLVEEVVLLGVVLPGVVLLDGVTLREEVGRRDEGRELAPDGSVGSGVAALIDAVLTSPVPVPAPLAFLARRRALGPGVPTVEMAGPVERALPAIPVERALPAIGVVG